MSVRPAAPQIDGARLQLEQLRATAVEFARAERLERLQGATAAAGAADAQGEGLRWEDLSHAEQAVTHLGVSPDSWNPIGDMNEAHHVRLIKENRLSSMLARRIEAFKYVSTK